MVVMLLSPEGQKWPADLWADQMLSDGAVVGELGDIAMDMR